VKKSGGGVKLCNCNLTRRKARILAGIEDKLIDINRYIKILIYEAKMIEN
jgi:hypothetical protein